MQAHTLIDMRNAAILAEEANFPTTLTMRPEGIEIFIVNGDRELILIATWSQISDATVSLTQMVRDALEAVRRDRETMFARVAGVRPVPPQPRYLP